MRVKMLTSVAGNGFAIASGSVVDLPAELANAFIQANYAIPADELDDSQEEKEEKYEKRPAKRKYERRST